MPETIIVTIITSFVVTILLEYLRPMDQVRFCLQLHR